MNLVLPVLGEAVAEISSEKDAAVDADARLDRVEEFRALEAALADLSLQLAAQQDAVFNPHTGELETLEVFSGYVAYQHWWQEKLRSTVTYGWVDVDNLDFQDDSDYASTDRAIINLMWPPVTRIDVGGELLWGRRENKDGASATARQIQFGAKYRF